MENIAVEPEAYGVRSARNDRELLLTRTFDAPRAQVYACWMDQLHARQWWGPHGFTVTSFDADERVGGTWRACMRSPEHDEGEELCATGTFREIVLDERIVYTWAWERDDGTHGHETLVTVTFADDGVRTRMFFRQGPFETVEDRESHESGWSEAFERLAAHVEQDHH